jgi:hypothetical protein
MLAMILLTGLSSLAQDFQDAMRSLPEDPAKEFARPLTDAFGADINTGWLSNAPSATILGFDFRIGLVAMGAFIDKDAEVFVLLDLFFPLTDSQASMVAQSIQGITNEERNEIKDQLTNPENPLRLKSSTVGPTFFGSKDDYVVVSIPDQEINVGGNTYNIPAQDLPLEQVRGILQDPGIFPLLAPQLSIGTLYGTQATFRYIPKTRFIDELGKVEYIAGGLQHNPLVWFANPLPIDFSVVFFYQQITIEDMAKVKSTAFGLNVSKTLGGFIAGFTPYAGFLIEETKMDINYEYEIIPGNPLVFDFEIEGANKNRFIMGFGLTLLGLNIFADYNFSSVNTLNLSVMYGF